jgi:hypothetical protein
MAIQLRSRYAFELSSSAVVGPAAILLGDARSSFEMKMGQVNNG